MSGFCPLITVYLTSRYHWKIAMLLPGFVALAIAPLIYMTIYNSPHEAKLPDVRVSASSEAKQLRINWTKLVIQLLRSPFLCVLIHGYFLASLMRNALSDWIQLYLIQDKKHSLSTGLTLVSFLWHH